MRLLKVLAALWVLAPGILAARERIQGDCARGGGQVTTQGYQSSSSTKVQRSYPSCTVRVYLAGTLTDATIYADDAETPKGNPFTADTSGHWYFYADNGRYDVQLSGGGIPVTFTVGDNPSHDPREQETIISVRECHARPSASASANQTAFQTCIDRLVTLGGGTLTIPAGVYNISTASLDLSAATKVHIRGAGESTVLNYSGPNWLFDVGATSIPADVRIESLWITIASPALGAIRVGRTAQAYADGLYRERWLLRDLRVDGPGAAVAGTIGLSLTQLGNGLIEKVSVSAFQQAILNDRSTVMHYTKVRANAFTYGWEFRKGDAPGNCQDTVEAMESGGPSAGLDGWALKLDHGDIRFFGSYFEYNRPAGVTAKAFIWFTANGNINRIYGSKYDLAPGGAGLLTNTMLFDKGASANMFFGEIGSDSMPIISMGAPSMLGNNRNAWVGCDERVSGNLLAAAITAGYATVQGKHTSGPTSATWLSDVLYAGTAPTPITNATGTLRGDSMDSGIVPWLRAAILHIVGVATGEIDIFTGVTPEVARIRFYEQAVMRWEIVKTAVNGFTIGSAASPNALQIDYNWGHLNTAGEIRSGAGLNIGASTTIAKHYSASSAWTPGAVADSAVATTVVTVNGCVVGDTTTVSFNPGLAAGVLMYASVTAANTVNVTLFNRTGGLLNLGLGQVRVDCWEH